MPANKSSSNLKAPRDYAVLALWQDDVKRSLMDSLPDRLAKVGHAPPPFLRRFSQL